MSRLHRYIHALASGYVSLIANAVFSLISIPLALRYLSKEQFGLWALASQLALYLSLVDFGMSPSITRIFIDHKETPSFGRVVFTAWVVLAVQAVIVGISGPLALAPFSSHMGVSPDQLGLFTRVLILQTSVLAFTFFLRIFSQLLDAHQYQHVTSYAQLAGLAANFATVWCSLRSGLGLLSLPLGQALGLLLQSAVTIFATARFHLMPRLQRSLDRAIMGELMRLGRDVFMIHVGAMVIMSSQVLLLSRWAGPAVAAMWTVCTRPFFLILTALNRLFDVSLPALAEMITRRETEILRRRTRSLMILTGSVSAWASVTFAFANESFVAWWTHGRIHWDPANDALLATWLFILAYFHCPAMLVVAAKQIRGMRYVFIAEGIISVALAAWLFPSWGVTGLVISYVAGSLVGHVGYSAYRAARYLEVPMRDTAWTWLKPAIATTLILVAVGLAMNPFTRHLPAFLSLLLKVSVLGLFGAVTIAAWGLDSSVRQNALQRLEGFRRKRPVEAT